MEKIKNDIYKITSGAIFVISSMLLSFYLIIDTYYTIDNIILTIAVSFGASLYFWKKTVNWTYEKAKKNVTFTIISTILAAIVTYKLYEIKGISCEEKFDTWLINPFRMSFFIFAFISLAYISTYICNKIKDWISNLYKELDSWDKKAYVIISVVFSLIIIIAYTFNSNWYMQYDRVYSLDSGWCFKNIFQNPSYYDIRHPLLSIFTFPIWAIIDTIVKIVFPENLTIVADAIIMQLLNIQLLILIGLQLKILTKNKLIFILYMLSFSTILFAMFFEKYQLCTFFIVLYVFTICNNPKKSTTSIISAVGVMPTSAFIGVSELCIKDESSKKLLKILKIILIAVIIFICLGRGHLLKNGIQEVLNIKNKFSNETMNISEKVNSTTKMIQNSFIALSSKEKNGIYTWDSLTTKFSPLSIVIVGIMIVGMIQNKEELFVKISSTWVMFAFLLFVLLNWSTHESPLFIMYFSWAIIPLFVMGLEYIIQKTKLNKKVVFGILFGLIFVINIISIINISKFLLSI